MNAIDSGTTTTPETPASMGPEVNPSAMNGQPTEENVDFVGAYIDADADQNAIIDQNESETVNKQLNNIDEDTNYTPQHIINGLVQSDITSQEQSHYAESGLEITHNLAVNDNSAEVETINNVASASNEVFEVFANNDATLDDFNFAVSHLLSAEKGETVSIRAEDLLSDENLAEDVNTLLGIADNAALFASNEGAYHFGQALRNNGADTSNNPETANSEIFDGHRAEREDTRATTEGIEEYSGGADLDLDGVITGTERHLAEQSEVLGDKVRQYGGNLLQTSNISANIEDFDADGNGEINDTELAGLQARAFNQGVSNEHLVTLANQVVDTENPSDVSFSDRHYAQALVDVTQAVDITEETIDSNAISVEEIAQFDIHELMDIGELVQAEARESGNDIPLDIGTAIQNRLSEISTEAQNSYERAPSTVSVEEIAQFDIRELTDFLDSAKAEVLATENQIPAQLMTAAQNRANELIGDA